MNRGKRRWGIVRWFAFGIPVLLATTSAHAAGQVDPDAVRILKRMTDQLAGMQQFSVRTQIVIEDVHSSGRRVDYDVSGDVTVKRPNKMRLVRSGEMNQRFYYDGDTITLYSPNENVYANRPAPKTLEEMIALARENVGIVMPAADLVYRDVFSRLMQDMKLATVVDKTVINGVKCDHLLFSRPGVDVQVWVAEGKPALPVKYVVAETDNPLMLSVSTTFSDWNMNPDVNDSTFKFVAPKGAKMVGFSQTTSGSVGKPLTPGGSQP